MSYNGVWNIPETFAFDIYPSWFGGEDQADDAIIELASSVSAKWQRQVADVAVDRTNPEKWIVKVEFEQ